MINEANRYDVLAAAALIERPAAKFSALALAHSCVYDTNDVDAVKRLMDAEANDLDAEFKRLATLLGYTLSKIPETAVDATYCEDCPPVGYPTDKTRCAPCPRRVEMEDAGQ